MLSNRDREIAIKASQFLHQYLHYLENCQSEGADEVRYYTNKYCELMGRLEDKDEIV